VEEQRRRRPWVHSWPLMAVAVGGLVLGCVLLFPRLLYQPLSITELQARGALGTFGPLVVPWAQERK
jgi:hypothetical protein